MEERRRQKTLLELLVHTGEKYQQELTCDRELFQVIALDAKGIAQSRITAKSVTGLHEKSAQIAAAARAEAQAQAQAATAKARQRNQSSTKESLNGRAASTQRQNIASH